MWLRSPYGGDDDDGVGVYVCGGSGGGYGGYGGGGGYGGCVAAAYKGCTKTTNQPERVRDGNTPKIDT